MTRPICTEIPHTPIRYNIGQNIGNWLNYVPCEQGVFAESGASSRVDRSSVRLDGVDGLTVNHPREVAPESGASSRVDRSSVRLDGVDGLTVNQLWSIHISACSCDCDFTGFSTHFTNTTLRN